MQRAETALTRVAVHTPPTTAPVAAGGPDTRPTPPPQHALARLLSSAQPPTSQPAPVAAPTAAPRVAVPDGRRTPQAEAKRLDNERRALEVQLTQRDTSFFGMGILAEGAPACQRDAAGALMARAHQAAARAHYISKDNRLGTALSKFEELAARLPDMHRFQGLRQEGDLDTSEYNERLLIAVAQYVRERPKAGGDLVVAKTVSGQVSAIKKCVEEHLGRPILAPSGGAMLARVTRAMAYEDGPAGERKYLAPLRNEHFAQLADPRCRFDCTSPGWPMMRWALLLTMHQCLMRGGEPGRLPRGAFRPALGLCWCHFVWLAPASTALATVRVKETGRTHWLLSVQVLSIKDTAARFQRVPIAIASKHPTSHRLGDPLCPYSAVLTLWRARERWVPPAARASTPFFLGPRGGDAVTTDEARDAIREAAAALGLDPSVFGGSACRRGGATDLRDQLGHAAAKQIIIDRGRWDKNGDIDDIYARASLEEHGAASVGLSSADHGPSLEEAHPGWVQPARWRRS